MTGAARANGRRAFMNGFPVTMNPYRHASRKNDEYKAWLKAWFDAELEAEKTQAAMFLSGVRP